MKTRMEGVKEGLLETRKRKVDHEEPKNTKKQEVSKEEGIKEGKEQEDSPISQALNKETEDKLEEFEIGASDFVSKQDAMKVYCLPTGTLAVCECIEKPNPRNSSWKPMKLYLRSEIRQRARDRFGGLDGLIKERKKREAKRFEKEMDKAKDFFG